MISVSTLLLPLVVYATPAAPRYSESEILDAIRFVESGDRLAPPDGDGGLSIGPYQISLAYWHDALEAEPEIAGERERCRDREYAERIVRAYMRRYVPRAWERCDAEVIARTHNGGPRGALRVATLDYWRKVKTRLEQQRRLALAAVAVAGATPTRDS